MLNLQGFKRFFSCFKTHEIKTHEVILQEQNKINYNETIAFVPPITNGYVIKVYDGDTITIAAKLPYPESPLYRFQVRLYGIDCPEIKGKTPEEKELAQQAKRVVEELVLHKHVILKNCQNEKYGRILANVYTTSNIHVNDYLLEKNLAYVYDGKTKKEWSFPILNIM